MKASVSNGKETISAQTSRPSDSPHASSSRHTAASPPHIPDHELLRCIGIGSYGEVWLARSVLGEYRAVKIVHRSKFEHDRPYEREFQGIKNYEPISRTHNSQVDILHVGRNDQAGYFYYVMELADDAGRRQKEECRMQKKANSSIGSADSSFSILPSALDSYVPRTLSHDVKQQGRLPIEECLQTGLALTTALDHLHQNGLVHRDVKPSNIIFVNGVPKLADIGLVTGAGEACSLVGTEGYMAPEGPGTAQADLYSLGKVLYEISMGRKGQIFPELPPDWDDLADSDKERLLELNEIILKACQGDLRFRYRTVREMGDDLALLRRGESVKRHRTLRQRWAACKKIGLAVVLLAVVTAATLLYLRRLPDTEIHSTSPEVEKLVKYADKISTENAPDRLAKAADHYKQAIQLDPKFAPAYIGLFYLRLLQYYAYSPDELSEENLRVAATGLRRFASSLAEGRLAAAHIKWLDGFQDEAVAEAEKATRMPACSKAGRGLVHELYGWYLLMTGDQEHSFQQYLLAEKDNVADPTIQVQLGNHYFVEHEFKKALEHFDRSIELQPNMYGSYYCRGNIHEEQGEFLEAIQEFQRGDQLNGKNEDETRLFYDELSEAFMGGGPTAYWQTRLDKASSDLPPDAHYIATLLAQLGKMDDAYRWLDKACNEGKLQGLWWDACWDHSDGRFKAIAKKARRRQ